MPAARRGRITGTQALVATTLVVPLVGAAAAAPDSAEGEVVTVLVDPDIVESSGLVVTDGLAVTVNDSGDSARIFTVDLATGETVGVTRWDAEVRDVEALAPAGEGHVWVGDIGDNLAARDSVVVTRVPFGRGDRDVVGEAYELVWPDGARDAESLLASPVDGRLHLVSKDPFGGQVYAAPKRLDPDRPNRLEPVAEVAGLITDGAFFPDGRHAVLRNYGIGYLHELPSWRQVSMFRLPPQQQGEGIAVSPDGVVHLSSEGVDSELLRITLPADARAALGLPPDGVGEPEPDGTEPDETRPGGTGPDEVDADEAGAEEAGAADVDWWPWALTGIGVVVVLAVLVRSLRPR